MPKRIRASRRISLASVILLVLLLAGAVNTTGARVLPVSAPAVSKPAHPHLDSNLTRWARAAGALPSGSPLTSTFEALLVKQVTVPVTVRLSADADPDSIAGFLGTHGVGNVQTGDGMLQAVVPVTLLTPLSEQPGVEMVRSIVPAHAAVVSQGAPIHGAPDWNTNGFTGAGVKVGVIDVGFTGYSDWMGTELPASVTGRCYPTIGVATSDLADCELRDRHGTAVAETIVDMAPDVSLYISNPQTPYDLNEAVAWMVSQGVTVINHSVGWGFEGPGDGTSRFSDSALRAVDTAVAAGITWINSAGNEGLSTWTGTYADEDQDQALEFASGVEQDGIYLSAGKTAVIQLRWQDTWGRAASDLDLGLYDSNGVLIRSSTDLQDGSSGDDPYEWFAYTPQSSGQFSVGVSHFGGPAPAWLEVQAFSGESLTYRGADYSICNPGESANPGMLAVGASYWATPYTIEPFSSGGPTRDGRVKPDLVGVDGADTASYGAFYGSSQSAPHVAGLAALVRQRFPQKSPADVAMYLRFNATPVGVASPNNQWGAGLAHLPPVGLEDNPFPSARGLVPAAAPVGSGDMTLTVSGEDFVEGSIVRWDGSDRPTTFANSTTLHARLSSADLVNPGSAVVTVYTPPPGGGISTPLIFTVASENPDFDAPEFARTWGRTDEPVAALVVSRTWMWGPDPASDGLFEEYSEGPAGYRFVQYFDKSRMEIATDPVVDPTSVWYVTNGLLSKELITGRMQLGDDTFEQHQPAQVNVAGDPDDATGPTYATFGPLLGAPALADGEAVAQRLSRDGTVSDDPSLQPYGIYAARRVQVPGIDHQVASVFWDFMNATGTVYQDGDYYNDLLFVNPFYATGYPITEAYWATVKVAGQYVEVLMQCFERRCLTYTPGNVEGWQVEAGNVGQHYYHWRYIDVPGEHASE